MIVSSGHGRCAECRRNRTVYRSPKRIGGNYREPARRGHANICADCAAELLAHANPRADTRQVLINRWSTVAIIEIAKHSRRCGATGIDSMDRCKRCGLAPDGDTECPPGFFDEVPRNARHS